MLRQFAFITLILSATFSMSSCEDDDDNSSETVLETGTVTDIENNTYNTVKIGDNWWMSENLSVTTFKNGTPINNAQDTSYWNHGGAGYCLYDNNLTSPGLLYNWEAVSSSNGLAPEGWHVATEEDWKALELYLGMSAEEIELLNWRNNGSIGSKLKIKAPAGWTKFESIWSDNASGFTALAGGCRLQNGTWAQPGLFAAGFWWSSSAKDNETAWFRHLDYKKEGVFRFYIDKKYGMSVRCVKNK
ncbi:MAG: hypothetical protein RLZZ543_540 [Bacteroidota bacterium]